MRTFGQGDPVRLLVDCSPVFASVKAEPCVARYVAAARGLWLSDRPLDERVRILRELTEHVQTIYFTRRWRVITTVPHEITMLRTKLDGLQATPGPQR